MKIFGHPWVDMEQLYSISNKEEIVKTPSNSTLKMEKFDINLMKHCQNNALIYIVEVQNIKEAIFANLTSAKYILCSKKLAIELMPIAQNYLFDTQILAYIGSENEIEEMAKVGVDGVYLK